MVTKARNNTAPYFLRKKVARNMEMSFVYWSYFTRKKGCASYDRVKENSVESQRNFVLMCKKLRRSSYTIGLKKEAHNSFTPIDNVPSTVLPQKKKTRLGRSGIHLNSEILNILPFFVFPSWRSSQLISAIPSSSVWATHCVMPAVKKIGNKIESTFVKGVVSWNGRSV